MGANSQLLRDEARHESSLLVSEGANAVRLGSERRAEGSSLSGASPYAGLMRYSGPALGSQPSFSDMFGGRGRFSKQAMRRITRAAKKAGGVTAAVGKETYRTAAGAMRRAGRVAGVLESGFAADDDGLDVGSLSEAAIAEQQRSRSARRAQNRAFGRTRKNQLRDLGKRRKATQGPAAAEAGTSPSAKSGAPKDGSSKRARQNAQRRSKQWAAREERRRAVQASWRESTRRARGAKSALSAASNANASAASVAYAAESNFSAAMATTTAGSATALGPIAFIIPIVVILALSLTLGSALMESTKSGLNIEGLTEVESAVAVKLAEMGFDNVHIAAIMGNIYAESSFDLGAEEGSGGIAGARASGTGVGLMGWTYTGYLDELEEIASKQGKAWTELSVQVEMMEQTISRFNGSSSYRVGPNSDDPADGTLVSGSRDGFDKASDVTACTEQFCYGYERPSIPHISRRIERAKYYLAILNSSTAGGSVKLSGGKLGNPLTGQTWTLSSDFGYRTFDNSHHNGIDMAAAEGTPYYAAESGTVLFATNGGGYNGGAGNWVVIDHGGGLVTKYMHSSVTFVKPGETVKKGQHIGNVGNTGASFGAHLHFQVELNGTPVDPKPYLGL